MFGVKHSTRKSKDSRKWAAGDLARTAIKQKLAQTVLVVPENHTGELFTNGHSNL